PSTGASPGAWVAYGYEAMASALGAIDRADDPLSRSSVVEAYFDGTERDSSSARTRSPRRARRRSTRRWLRTGWRTARYSPRVSSGNLQPSGCRNEEQDRRRLPRARRLDAARHPAARGDGRIVRLETRRRVPDVVRGRAEARRRPRARRARHEAPAWPRAARRGLARDARRGTASARRPRRGLAWPGRADVRAPRIRLTTPNERKPPCPSPPSNPTSTT